jgi:undecaprenyl-diphosphatase
MRDLNDDAFLAVNHLARETPWLHAVVVDYAKYGVLLFGAAILLAIWRSRTADARMLAASVWTGLATLLAVAVNQPIGRAVAEARPYVAHPSALLLVDRTSDFSFPSDHAVMAGAVSVGLLIAWWRLGLVVSVAAVAMALTRVYVGAHYPGDVLAGLALGGAVVAGGWLLLGRLLTRLAEWLRTGRCRPLLVSGEPADATSVKHPVGAAAAARRDAAE